MAMAFENYWNETKQWEENNKHEMFKIIPINTPTFNENLLLKNINDIPNMDDIELRKFIEYHFNDILNKVSSSNQQHINCFLDIRFLDGFIDVLCKRKYFQLNEVVKINNICYDYLSLKNSMYKNMEITNRMIRISNIINSKQLPRLLGLGISNTLASVLLIARYSSFSIDICVRRVDFIIITQPKLLMTQEMITEILRILYEGNDIWVKVFQYFMLDVIPEYNEYEESSSWVTEEMEEINSVLNLSVLTIIDNMPSRNITSIFVNYAEAYSLLNSNKPYRFSLKSLNNEFSRMNNIINYLRTQNIYVP